MTSPDSRTTSFGHIFGIRVLKHRFRFTAFAVCRADKES
jgi:hypothetical protein